MSTPLAGFREIEHTADWELHVWGPDIQSLFEQSAKGMYTLCGIHWVGTKQQEHLIEIKAVDLENLLVCFLAELLYIYEKDGLGFNQFEINITGNSLRANVVGTAISAPEKEIKAVTYHNLQIRQFERGWEVNIVFDV